MQRGMRDPERTKKNILSAAERVIAAKGLRALTLDEVASSAGVSKGGLLHHFASKSALVDGLAESMIVEHAEEVEARRKADAAAPGAYTRALLRTNLAFTEECTQVCATMTAESRNYPGMRELFARYTAGCQARCEADGLDPVTATIVRYAVEGMMSADIWGMPRPSNYDQVVARMLELAGESGEKKKTEKTRKKG